MTSTRRTFIQGMLAAAFIGYELIGLRLPSRLQARRKHFYSNSFVVRRCPDGSVARLSVIDFDERSRIVVLEDGTVERWRAFAIAYANTYDGVPCAPERDASRRVTLRQSLRWESEKDGAVRV